MRVRFFRRSASASFSTVVALLVVWSTPCATPLAFVLPCPLVEPFATGPRVLGAMWISVLVVSNTAFALEDGSTDTALQMSADSERAGIGLAYEKAHTCSPKHPYINLLTNRGDAYLGEHGRLHMSCVQFLCPFVGTDSKNHITSTHQNLPVIGSQRLSCYRCCVGEVVQQTNLDLRLCWTQKV